MSEIRDFRPTEEELDQLRHNCEYHRGVACMVNADQVIWLMDELDDLMNMYAELRNHYESVVEQRDQLKESLMDWVTDV